MQDSFDQKKQAILKDLALNSEDSPDASPKGTVDVKCLPIIHLINSNDHMVTTSSCSGRVSVFLEGVKEVQQGDTKIGAKGNQGRWLFVTHDPDDLDDWHHNIEFHTSEEQIPTDINTRYILYKFEPLILHVKCRDQDTAKLLYTTAMNCGFRESGIGSNNIVAIRISIKLDVPIGYLNVRDESVLLVTKQYLDVLTRLSHDRFRENFKKMDQLHASIETSLFSSRPSKPAEETKEQRRERKIREGLERKAALQKAEKEKVQEQEKADTQIDNV
ncbi:putative trna-YW synthesizing protein [Scheffersomyces amazonensis]|uniref:putative trna-YW synthesizing protein n=1 Tax=Scheffersomyces amazonensis TaxID=1078765 RepID=UPI00315D6DBA